MTRYNRRQRKAIQKSQDDCAGAYCYRRVWRWLEMQGIHRNRKTVLRIMKQNGLLSDICRRRKWVQLGQQVHKYKNLLNRQFHAHSYYDLERFRWVIT